ncbi:capsid maturation protease and MuF-like fusion protein [Streptomyces phage Maih]|uniref:Capsid maturation protease and MuF-like fusion protein n=1 Tax=Streptomyces phage Maih TaxID=1775283 RepID=A0A0U4K3G9_9CAUD|nr:capsid maturation protease and MuF-like fusion protein [Streptomyces phage Maih]
MTDEELEALLEELEAGFREDVQAQLTLTATEFADAVAASTELVAAAFSVSRIRDMWNRRVPGLVRRLRGIAGRSARATAEELDEPVPSTEELDEQLGPYLEATTLMLNAVGDRLATDATQALAEGVGAGDTLPELKARMIATFNDSGAQLGPVRAERIAQTESTRAWNAGALASAQALTGPDRPLVKQWLTRNDERVRQAHRDANGQLQLLDDPFDVGGTPMMYPGDPSAPADLTIQCRCIMRTAVPADATAERTASMEQEDDLAAAAEVHTGAMIALMPSRADAERMAFAGGEEPDQLHVTLAYLGDAADWSEAQRIAVINAVGRASGWLSPVQARAFGVARWNSSGPEPVWVWNIGDSQDDDSVRLTEVHQEVAYQVADLGYELPRNFTPWSPHVTATYGAADQADLDNGTGPLVFDRIRVAFAGEYTDFPLTMADVPDDFADESVPEAELESVPALLTWSTPGDTALAFENQQTGDGRVFSPGALFWEGDGPWPLQYADEMRGGHDGAELAGAIHTMGRAGDRIAGDGVLYLTQQAGAEAALLLGQGAPLGVSVDLDDVDIEMVDATGGETFTTKLITASVLPLPDGGWSLDGETQPSLTASGTATVIASQRVALLVSPDGTVPASVLTAAAGQPDAVDGQVVDAQRSGDYLVRITRGRVRGATLVTIPAYANARIVLDNAELIAASTATLPEHDDADLTAASQSSDYDRVLRHVRRSNTPVGAARVAQFLKVPLTAVHRHLARAAQRGEVVRLARGLYTDRTTSVRADHVMTDDRLADDRMVASVTGAVDLPVAERDHRWDGDAAATRVFEWAGDDPGMIGDAFAYRDDSKDPLTKGAYKLGYADVLDGVLTIIPSGVAAALGALNGARGGVDLPEDERGAVRDRLEAVRSHVIEESEDDDMDDLTASAWTAMRDLPAMPAAWFAEPTVDELPPGGPGVNYSGGRIFGWVAQTGEAHAGFAKKVTIDGLGRIDTSHFLRQRFTLDDGSTVKAGAFTMNAGHHRDGAECETSACQFDDTRTVAGVVTVGMNDRGMWFSGAAAPWMSEWDRTVFMATQPSYHMRKGPSGNWQLRAVLAVPVPGHSSPLLASAVIERSQMALTASATMAEVEQVIETETARQEAEDRPVATATVEVTASLAEAIDYDALADALVAATERAELKREAERAELEALLAEGRTMAADDTGTEGN